MKQMVYTSLIILILGSTALIADTRVDITFLDIQSSADLVINEQTLIHKRQTNEATLELYATLLEENQDYCVIQFNGLLSTIDGASKQWDWGTSEIIWSVIKPIGSIGKYEIYAKASYNGNISKLAPSVLAH